MTRALCSEGWMVDKVRMINQIKPKYRKWTPEITEVDRDECNRKVIDPYDYEPLHHRYNRRTCQVRCYNETAAVY